MDPTYSQASDDPQGPAFASDRANGLPSRPMDADLEIGYEAAAPWLQPPLWDEAMHGRDCAVFDR